MHAAMRQFIQKSRAGRLTDGDISGQCHIRLQVLEGLLDEGWEIKASADITVS